MSLFFFVQYKHAHALYMLMSTRMHISIFSLCMALALVCFHCSQVGLDTSQEVETKQCKQLCNFKDNAWEDTKQ